MISSQRSHFDLPKNVRYLNVAYMAPLHEKLVAAGSASVARQCNPPNLGRGAIFAEVDELRELFAQLIGLAEPSRIAIMPSASYGLATAAKNLRPESHQNIIVAGDQFPSNYYAWSRACFDTGAELRTVAPPNTRTNRARIWNQRLLEAIDRNTKVVALPNAHWSDGTLFDLAALRTRTTEVCAALVVDGTQSVGVVPLDLEAVPLDALICSGYKTLLGPYGTAFGYFGPSFDSGSPIEETWIGRRGSDEFANLANYQERYRDHALRYEAGGRSNFITMPMVKAALELLLEWTPQAISAYCAAITEDLPGRLREQGFWIEESKRRSSHLFGIRTPPTLNPESCFRRLGERGIAVSLRGDAIRVSPHVYNTHEDIEALLEAVLST